MQQHLGQRQQATARITALDLMRSAGLEPDAWQQQLLTSTARQQLWLAHRQFGKSTCVGALAWETAVNIPGSLTLLVSRTLRQSVELLRKVKMFARSMANPVQFARESEMSLETVDGSRIISLPANPDTVVGFSAPELIVLDEAARIPDVLYLVLRPMMAMSRGRLIALSTPWGKRGWFYNAWAGQATETALDVATVQALLADLGMTVTEADLEGEAPDAFAWERLCVTAPQNPRLSRAYLANERRTIPDLIFRSEWLCEFVDSQDAVFRWEDLQAMLSDDVPPIWSGLAEAFSVLSDEVKPFFAGSEA